MNEATIALETMGFHDGLVLEQPLTTVLQNTATAFLIFDAEAHLVFANPAGQKLLDHCDLRPGQRLPADSGYESLEQLLSRARRSHELLAGDVIWHDKRLFSAEIIPMQEGSYVVVLHDVSRFQELQKQKNEFISMAAHDLRNPITSITGFSHLLKQVGSLDSSQNDFVQRIQDSTVRMSELVENMMSLAELDPGEGSQQREIDITQMLYELAYEFQPQMERRNQSLVIETTNFPTRVLGIAIQLRRALRNLIQNAIKNTAGSGLIIISLEQESNLAKIRIKDSGSGIPPADLPHVFERSYRNRTRDPDFTAGDGFGLAIVKLVAEQHGGHVSVESEVGNGSCFTLAIPLLPAQPARQIQ